MKTQWIKNELPLKNGHYWLYGAVWEDKIKLHFFEAKEVSNGFIYIMEGNFVYHQDIRGNFYITNVIFPRLPSED